MVLQALGINYHMLAASETNAGYRDFFLLNMGEGKFDHVFRSVEEQLAEHQPPKHVDLMITGSPCDPFSVQRCKRFRAGNVKEHCDFKVTMQSVIQMYEKYAPAIGVMEQVMGFLMPFEKDGQVTPCDRRGPRFFGDIAT